MIIPHKWKLTLALISLSVSGLLLALAAKPERAANTQTPKGNAPHAYHKDPPTGPLPTTISPGEFPKNKAAFVAYCMARKIPDLLYQLPCYCGCDTAEGHASLLDCFVTKHGELCHTCQAEVFSSFELQKLGRNAAELRQAFENRAFLDFDFDHYVHGHIRECKRHSP